MSWQMIINGRISFKENVDERRFDKTINDLKEITGCLYEMTDEHNHPVLEFYDWCESPQALESVLWNIKDITSSGTVRYWLYGDVNVEWRYDFDERSGEWYFQSGETLFYHDVFGDINDAGFLVEALEYYGAALPGKKSKSDEFISLLEKLGRTLSVHYLKLEDMENNNES